MKEIFFDNNIVFDTLKYIVGIILGIFSTWYYIRRENRQIILKKRIIINRLGFTADHQDWGNIEVIYDGQSSNNINFIWIEIINDTNRDCDPMILEFALANGCVIYKDKAQYISNGVVKDLLQTDATFNHFHSVRERVNQIRAQAPPNNHIPATLQAEVDSVVRNRKYVVDALNRNSKVVIQVMAENNIHTTIEAVDVTADILQKGIKVIPILDEEANEKRKKRFISFASLIIFLVNSYLINRYSEIILASVSAMIINVFFSYYVSFPIYSILKWIKKELF